MALPRSIKLTKDLQNCKTYDEFKEKMLKKKGRYPLAGEILQFWDANKDIYRKMCPNPCKCNGVRDAKTQ